MRTTILFLTGAACILGLTGIAVGPATRFGLLDPRTGIGLLLILAIPIAVATLGGLLAIGLATWKMPALLGVSVLGLIPALVVTAGLLLMKQAADNTPVIHDITTDFANPPKIVAGADAQRDNPPGYDANATVPRSDGRTLADVQKAAFPDIQSLTLPLTVTDARDNVRRVLRDMGLTILDERVLDDNPDAWAIEATHRSTWFGFIDDVVIRIDDIATGQSRIDIRSKSRIGMSDLGANAKRVRNISQRLTAQHQGS